MKTIHYKLIASELSGGSDFVLLSPPLAYLQRKIYANHIGGDYSTIIRASTDNNVICDDVVCVTSCSIHLI